MFFRKNKTQYAPIALFVWNRIDHPMQGIKNLLQNSEAKYTDLYIFSDGPRYIDDEEKIKSLRNKLHKIHGFKSVTVFERKTNYGLAINLIDGISRILETNDSVIVLEDDILVNTNFLAFMNQCLQKYKNNKEIFTIQATTGDPDNVSDVITRVHPNCCGWAIWKDRWALYERNVTGAFLDLNKNNMELRGKLNNNNSINISWQIDANLRNQRTTWAVYLNYTSIKYNKLNIYPRYQIVKNIGQDGTGIHKVVENTADMNKQWDTKNFILPNRPPFQQIDTNPDANVLKYNETLRNELNTDKYSQFMNK